MRRLEHFFWLCQVVSPISRRERIVADTPEPLNWELTVAAASAHRVAPFVFPWLEQTQLLELMPSEAHTALEQLYLPNAEQQCRAHRAGRTGLPHSACPETFRPGPP